MNNVFSISWTNICNLELKKSLQENYCVIAVETRSFLSLKLHIASATRSSTIIKTSSSMSGNKLYEDMLKCLSACKYSIQRIVPMLNLDSTCCSDSSLYYIDPLIEIEKMLKLSNNKWRLSHANKNYSVCSTYPSLMLVPSKISDTVVAYAAKFRSKGRIPLLSYIHPQTQVSKSCLY